MGIKGEPWAMCPLKQEIRVGLWEPFVRSLTGGRPLQNYLTLYSPSLMDVKHFADTGLIEFDEQKQMYRGVVGVAHDGTAFANAIKLGLGRPEGFFRGNINEILTRVKNPHHKQVLEKFPFETINLDYEDSIFHSSVSFPISDHVEALDCLFDIQKRKNCQKFCLFFTTRAEQSQLAPHFMSRLERIIDQNFLIAPSFGQAFHQTYSVNSATDLLSSSYDDFTTLGLIKLITSMLSDHDYEIINCEVKWLSRDCKGGHARLLHAAFMIEKSSVLGSQRASDVLQYGRRKFGYHARYLTQWLRSRATNGLTILKESEHFAAMQAKYGADIDRLLSETFQWEVPPHDGVEN